MQDLVVGFRARIFFFSILACSFKLVVTSEVDKASMWDQLKEPPASKMKDGSDYVHKIGTHYHLNMDLMRKSLEEGVISLPLNDGSFVRFTVRDTTTEIMHPDLARKFSGIKTYHIKSLDSQVVANGDVSLSISNGFHAQIVCYKCGHVYIDPHYGSTRYYTSYSVHENSKKFQSKMHHSCHSGMDDDNEIENPDGTESKHHHHHHHRRHHRQLVAPQNLVSHIQVPTQSNNRIYRIAIAANADYCRFFGNSVNSCLAAVVTCMNRVSGIYKRELGIGLQLVANSDRLLCIDCPHISFFGSGQEALANDANDALQQVTGFINRRLSGSSADSTDYDIGHVLTTAPGGKAARGVCSNINKAIGTTGAQDPQGDAFWVSYVAHEIGHQFGARHSWNGNQKFCRFSDWDSSTAYEPGSGSTIMSYAGICSDSVFLRGDNIQQNSDSYFHLGNLDEIQTYIATDTVGSSCGNVISSSNNMPTVNVSAFNINIPKTQPFVLVPGHGADADSDTLLWSWEQIDLGFAQAPLASPISTGTPRFRSYPPTTAKERFFPNFICYRDTCDDLIWEQLPTAAGTMNFAVTVRDHFNPASDVGYGSWDADRMQVNVYSVGPLVITNPTISTVWAQNATATVTWNVAGTQAITPFLSIELSVDDGLNFPFVIAANVSNAGSAVVNIPCVGNGRFIEARLMVKSKEAAGANYWYALSPKFRLGANGDCIPAQTPPPTPLPPYTGQTPVPTPSPIFTPTSAPTRAPTPKTVIKVEFTARFANVRYSSIHSSNAANAEFTASWRKAVTAASSASSIDEVRLRYIERLQSGNDLGILVDGHVDFDAATEANKAPQFVSKLNAGGGQVFSTANGFDTSQYGVPTISNITQESLDAPGNLCAADKTCHFIVWEAWNSGESAIAVYAQVGDQIIFFWNGDESIYSVQTQAEYDSCDFSNATKLSTQTDEKRSMYGHHINEDVLGKTIYFVSGTSAQDHISATLCSRGLKAAVHVEDNRRSRTTSLLDDENLALFLLGAFAVGAVLFAIYWNFCRNASKAKMAEFDEHERGDVASVRDLHKLEAENRTNVNKFNPTRGSFARSPRNSSQQQSPLVSQQKPTFGKAQRRQTLDEKMAEELRKSAILEANQEMEEEEEEEEGGGGGGAFMPKLQRISTLPPGWTAHHDGENIYYYNERSGKSQWHFPTATDKKFLARQPSAVHVSL